MALDILDREIRQAAEKYLAQLERELESDVIFFYGEIFPGIERILRDVIEALTNDQTENRRDSLSIILNTPGGSAETTEKLVRITRHHYEKVYFVVPDSAMSAGTIWCMSGDKIYMDYSSALGPIDPQVHNGTTFVPALNYLDKVDELINKSAENTLTQAEFIMLRELDLAELRTYEQARDLTITLLEQWLVKYKFRAWTHHRTNAKKKGQPVTEEEKRERAREIAQKLNDTSLWHSHGRSIGVESLKQILRLEIDDYTDDIELSKQIRQYSDMLTGYISRMGFKVFLQSRNFF